MGDEQTDDPIAFVSKLLTNRVAIDCGAKVTRINAVRERGDEASIEIRVMPTNQVRVDIGKTEHDSRMRALQQAAASSL